MRFLVAIPVFNESRYVERVVQDVRAHVPHVLVVDDGSTDETPEILDRMTGIPIIRHPENRGYGQSLIDAFRWADRRGYDWIITIDCDDQHEPAGIPAFVDRAVADDADVISGSRYREVLPGSTDAPQDRRSINRRITKLLNCVLGLSLTDGFCGFKAYRVAAISSLRLTIPGYAFPMQFWTQAAVHDLRICEIPVPLIYNDPTRHFGGVLDDPASRYRHYLEVFQSELQCAGRFDGSHAACVEAALAGEA
jgi:dolichol-phosphate mannosyltransferase